MTKSFYARLAAAAACFVAYAAAAAFAVWLAQDAVAARELFPARAYLVVSVSGVGVCFLTIALALTLLALRSFAYADADDRRYAHEQN